MGPRLLITCLGLALTSASLCLADTLKLRDGRELSGRLNAESYAITTTTDGKVVVPLQAISRIDFQADEQVDVHLVDGRTLAGRWNSGEVLLQRDLFSNSFAPAEVVSLSVDPRAEIAVLPAGSRVRLMLAEWLSSRSAAPGQEVRFCLAEDLNLGGRVVLPRGTPATGKISAAQSAGKTSRQGELSVEAGSLTTPDGKVLSLTGGAGEFEGGLDAANFVAMGVFGFLASGQDVMVPAGTRLDAMTATGEQIELVNPPADREPWRHCREFFRFADGSEVKLEELDLKAAYAPFDRSLTLSFPISQLRTGAPFVQRLNNLLVYDTYLPSLTLELVKGKKLSEINLSMQIAVLPSHDKLVGLRATLYDGKTRVASDDRLNIDAEEKKTRPVSLSIKLPSETLDRLRSSPEARLRLEVTVRQ